jgi:hypothetical protein
MTITMVGNHALNGVRGWLLLLCVSLTVLGPLAGAASLIGLLAAANSQLTPPSTLHYVVMLPGIGALAFSAIAGVMLWRRTSRAVPFVRLALMLQPAVLILSVVVFRAVGLPVSMRWPALAQAAVIALIWLAYLHTSVRVSVTYGSVAGEWVSFREAAITCGAMIAIVAACAAAASALGTPTWTTYAPAGGYEIQFPGRPMEWVQREPVFALGGTEMQVALLKVEGGLELAAGYIEYAPDALPATADAIERVGRGLLRQMGTTGAVVQPDDQDVRVRPHDPAGGNAALRGFVIEGQRTPRVRAVSHAFVSGTRLYFASALFDQRRTDHPSLVQRFIESMKVPGP